MVHTEAALIRPVSRMDGLAGTSLKPIRCTERETAFPSSVMLYVVMAAREHRAGLYSLHACMLLFLCALSHVQLSPSFLSVPSIHFFHPPSRLSLPCVYTASSHMHCYLVVLVRNVAELHLLVQQIKGRIPLWDY